MPTVGMSIAGNAARTKVKINRNMAALEAAPAEFKCALDGKFLINPIKSPYGHVFEKRSLEKWMESVGSVCPVTERPLKIDDCLPHTDLKKSITKWLKDQGILGRDSN